MQCSAGVAGDMLLGALVDAGADRQAVFDALGGLGVDGYALTFERVQRCGVAATWANVVVDDHHDHEHRPAGQIHKLLDAADLPERVRQPSAGGVRARWPPPKARSTASIPTTSSSTRSAPSTPSSTSSASPPPSRRWAIDELVAGPDGDRAGDDRRRPRQPCPTRRRPSPACSPRAAFPSSASTPTSSWRRRPVSPPSPPSPTSFGPLPAMTVTAVGYGAGRADTAGRPNVVQVIVGEATPAGAVAPPPGRQAVQVDVNVDDVTGEVIAHTIAALVSAGAFDAWATPIVMKKGRPAHVVSALCDPALVERVAARPRRRDGQPRRAGDDGRALAAAAHRESSVEIGGHRIGVKLGAGRGQGRARRRRGGGAGARPPTS